jgi:hypothetical protein
VLKTPRSETNPEESTTKTTVVIKELHNEKNVRKKKNGRATISQ